jgi:hypothetical protein
MSNTFFEFPLLRLLNTLLLAGILATLILILLRIREPISVHEPVAVAVENRVDVDIGGRFIADRFLRRQQSR